MDLIKPIIDGWLESDLKAPRKQRHTAVRVYSRLMAEYPERLKVRERTISRYVSLKKEELYHNDTSDCAIYGDHPFGEAQLDFGEVYYYNKDDLLKKSYELVLSFPASNAAYVQLCHSQNQEMNKMSEIMNPIK